MHACWECKGGGWDESLRTQEGGSAQLCHLVSSRLVSLQTTPQVSKWGGRRGQQSEASLLTTQCAQCIQFCLFTRLFDCLTEDLPNGLVCCIVVASNSNTLFTPLTSRSTHPPAADLPAFCTLHVGSPNHHITHLSNSCVNTLLRCPRDL